MIWIFEPTSTLDPLIILLWKFTANSCGYLCKLRKVRAHTGLWKPPCGRSLRKAKLPLHRDLLYSQGMCMWACQYCIGDRKASLSVSKSEPPVCIVSEKVSPDPFLRIAQGKTSFKHISSLTFWRLRGEKIKQDGEIREDLFWREDAFHNKSLSFLRCCITVYYCGRAAWKCASHEERLSHPIHWKGTNLAPSQTFREGVVSSAVNVYSTDTKLAMSLTTI